MFEQNLHILKINTQIHIEYELAFEWGTNEVKAPPHLIGNILI